MPEYIALEPWRTIDEVLAATPRRSREEQAAQDVWDAWHKPGSDRHALHLIVWRIDGETVRPMRVGVHRRVEVRPA